MCIRDSRKTPLWRPKRRGILRNAAIALGNSASRLGLETLALGINDTEPLVRGASAWAIGKHRFSWPQESLDLLHDRLTIETEETVRAEIETAISDKE